MCAPRLVDQLAALAASCSDGNPLVTGEPGVVALPWALRAEASRLVCTSHATAETRYSISVVASGVELTVLLARPTEHLELAAARFALAPRTEDDKPLSLPRYGSGGFMHGSRLIPFAGILVDKVARTIERQSGDGSFASSPARATDLEATLATLLSDASARYRSPDLPRSLARAVIDNPGLVDTASALVA